ncbi:peptidyl-prolyl cis-trans isomerase CYP59-like isoform X2 [Diospyros lotus]|uniref:peptidyl-prolyl cis-trans isomerase CYP59-like isoform X2 n=1 Tax=Diospyros lotus TaxID=55363 RepID=UPI0022523825|nr:peptidyl-prolyl cis-trans isomerase CYP59-like isoform X2 [Diospyros lotus]
MSVLIVTSLGDIVMDLHTDLCPLTCKNFLKLCKIKYYNGCLFHTVQKDFTAQTGDPTGTGAGGDSIYKFLYGDQARFFGDEIHLDLKHTKMGTVAMASAGENLNASQFYITLRDDLDYLDGKHTVFGEVAEGLDTLQRLNEAYVDEKGRPFRNIRIKHTYILDDPFEDPAQLAELIPDPSPEGKPKEEVEVDVRLEDDWVPMDEQLDASELEEVLRAKAAHSSAVVLESIGDIPEAETKPPDNVLFVCKLNPVTEDEDLHTIFSRFGVVTSAEIIRDYKTGDSLCYAFIEFESNEACEQAYFKMDNALIDDRRIHVDFSQSVAKLWSQYRRKDSQKGKGGGCFKCGATDHIAKDCTGDPSRQQSTKYILKDDNSQRGGTNNSRYEMVFDEETARSPPKERRQRDYEIEERNQRRKVEHQSAEDLKEREHERSRDRHGHGDRTRENRDHDRHRHGDRTRENRDHERNRESRASQSSRRSRDFEYHDDRRDREKHMQRHGHRDDSRTDARDYKKRSADGVSSADRKEDGRDNEGPKSLNIDNGRQTKDDDSSHRRNRDERDYGKKSRDIDDYRDHDRGRDREIRHRGDGRR